MNVSTKAFPVSKSLRHEDKLFHRIVGVLNNARAQKEAFNVVPFVEIDRKLDHLFGLKSRSLHVRRAAIDAVRAVPNADVREQELEQRYTPPVRRIAVANTHAFGVTDSVNV